MGLWTGDGGVRIRDWSRAYLLARLANLLCAHPAVCNHRCRSYLRDGGRGEACLHRRDADDGFLPATRRRDDSGPAPEIPSPEHGRPSNLHRDDAFPPPRLAAGTMAARCASGHLDRDLSADPEIRPALVLLSRRFLVIQSVCMATVVQFRRLVRHRRRQAHIVDTVLAGRAMDFDRLPAGRVLRNADL